MNAHIVLTFKEFNPRRLDRRRVFDTFEEAIAFSKTDLMSDAEMYVRLTSPGWTRERHCGTLHAGGLVEYTEQWLIWQTAAHAVPVLP